MKKLHTFAVFFGLTAVSLGALGAHGLRDRLVSAGMLAVWETAVLYHLVHAVALFAAALAGRSHPRLKWAGWFWSGGMAAFSGSLYVLALGGPRWLGPITPLGGLALMIGWLLAGWSLWRDQAEDGRR